jgi:hypothetical protein
MKKFVLALVFLLSVTGIQAGEYIFFTIEYPSTYTIISSSIVSSECPADGKCYCMVSVTYLNKDSLRNPDNNIGMMLVKVPGFSSGQDPVISFKQNTFLRNIVVDSYTTTQSY